MKPMLLKRLPSLFLLPLATTAFAANEASPRGGASVTGVSSDLLATSESAQEVIGHDVVAADGRQLGKIKDLLIDSRDGGIAYALVESGAVLGLGGELRAVPFSAFNDTFTDAGALTLDLGGRDWKQLAPVSEDQLESLGDPATLKSTYTALGQQVPARFGASDGTPQPKLFRVSELNDKEVVSEGAEVGEIEGILVNLQHDRAAALMELEDEVAGFDRKLVVGFNQLELRGRDNVQVATTLTRRQLESAVPAPEDWWAARTSIPYRWSGSSANDGPTGPDSLDAANPAGVANRSEPSPTGRPSITAIASAMRMNNELPESARQNVSVEDREGKIVLSGQVESEAVKEQVARVVVDASGGLWQIDNEITVGSAAE